MKLAISNIAWSPDQDEEVYTLMRDYGFTGLEIAPTRVFPESPYDNLKMASNWAVRLKGQYGFTIPSMQSIWYGRTENIFGTEKERLSLISYTKKAINFAAAIGCENLVFGCPRNRNIPDGKNAEDAVMFFREIANYATERGTIVGMEANPSIYNTNFINDTNSALRLIKEVNSPGFKLNLDLGTMIYNKENPAILTGNIHLINHVHISEPGLSPIAERLIHGELYKLLKAEGYNRFVSIEMGKNGSIETIKKIVAYVGEVFAG